MTLGQRIQELRKNMQLSQEELGERMGVSRQAISKWEGDQTIPELDKLIALSKLFGLTVGQLLGVEQPVPAPAAPQGTSRKQRYLFAGIGALFLILAVAVGALWAQVQALNRQASMDEEYILTQRPLFQTAECQFSDLELGFPQGQGTQELTMDFTLKPVPQLKNWTVIGLTASVVGHSPWGKDGYGRPHESRDWNWSETLPVTTSWGTGRASLTIPDYSGEAVTVSVPLQEKKTRRTIEVPSVFIVQSEIESPNFVVASLETEFHPEGSPMTAVPQSLYRSLPDPRFET